MYILKTDIIFGIKAGRRRVNKYVARKLDRYSYTGFRFECWQQDAARAEGKKKGRFGWWGQGAKRGCRLLRRSRRDKRKLLNQEKQEEQDEEDGYDPKNQKREDEEEEEEKKKGKPRIETRRRRRRSRRRKYKRRNSRQSVG